MTISQEQLEALYDAEVVDQDGEKVGSLGQVYVDNGTGEAAWITVRTGWFGGRKIFVPLSTAELVDGQIRVPYPSAMIKDAPDIDISGHLSENDEQDLFDYYAPEVGETPAT
ncbi:PRC-barrel domain-containing protein [Ornithinimicrobium sp. W1679]|uniref:PRC-barrel domain-containing protein n=1 Tax=unclassified Ornithinimicrobium TaxID=2615080 RepID=UPI003CE9360F